MSEKNDFNIKGGQFVFREQPYLLSSRVSDGIPAFPAELILQHDQVKTKIMLIRGLCPLQAKDFEHLIMPVIHSVVRHMHLLPATEAHHHREMMGLLTHSLDVAHRALVGAKSQAWNDGFSECWQVAAMLAGLLSDIGVPYENILVQRGSDGMLWDRTEPLADWLSDSETTKYYLSWQPGRVMTHKQLTQSLPMAKTVISSELQCYLAPVWEDFCIAIDVQGSKTKHTLKKILNQANWDSVVWNVVVSHDAELTLGSMPPLWFNYLFMIVTLVQSKYLTVNRPDSAVFITKNLGVMLDLYSISNISKTSSYPVQYPKLLWSSSVVRQALADMDKLIPLGKQSGELVHYWSVNLHLENDGELMIVNRKLIRLSAVARNLLTTCMPDIVQIEATVAGK